MEEINQNPEVSQIYQAPNQIPQQPSKNWLIKYLLIGVLGLIVVVPIEIFWIFIPQFSLRIISLNVYGWGFILIPLAWVVFFILTLFIGYRRHISISIGEKPHSLAIELLSLILGGGIGFWVILQTEKVFKFLRLESIGQTEVGIISSLSIFLSITLGSYLSFKILHLLTGKIGGLNFIKQPLIWFALIFFSSVPLSLMWANSENSTTKIDLTDIQAVIIPSDDDRYTYKEGYYQVVVTAQLNPSPSKYKYDLGANLDTKQAGCPSVFSTQGANISPGDSRVKIKFIGTFGFGEPALYKNINCSYSLSYNFSLVIGGGLNPISDPISKTIYVTWENPPAGTSSCIQDSDCPQGLVCVGRGPTQPSKEVPGVCLPSKASQSTY